MAYETVLNITPSIVSIPSSVITSNTYSTTLKLTTSGTTLGSALTDEVLTLVVNTTAAGGAPLSATSLSGTVVLNLSSALSLPTPQVWPGVISSSTFNGTASIATLTITFPQRSLLTTVLNLSANTSTTQFDSTKTSALDNFFYLTGSPDVTHQVRTTGGHASLVSYLG